MAHRLGAAIAAAVAGIGLHASSSAASDPAGAETALARFGTEGAISAFLGPRPSCVSASSTTRLCEWLLSARDPGFRAVAAGIGTGDRVGVLCELPAARVEREVGSCTGHPRRSNRSAYNVSRLNLKTAAARRRREHKLEVHRELASGELAAAGTLLSISRLLGCAPAQCDKIDAESQLCTWRLSKHTYGHGTVAASIRAEMSKQVRLRCHLPLDGSLRTEDSCSAQIGN